MKLNQLLSISVIAGMLCACASTPTPIVNVPPTAALSSSTLNAPAGDDTLAPNRNLQVSGVPPIRMQLVKALAPYTNIKPTSLISWHPTDGSLTISRREAQSTQLFRIAQPGAKAEPLTNFAEPVRSAKWESHGRYLLIGRDKGGNEANQIFRYDPVTKQEVQLTADGFTHSRGPWNTSKTKFLLRSAPLDKAGGSREPIVTIRALDPMNPQAAETLITLEGAGFYPALWREEEKKLWLSQYISATERKLFEVDLATGKRKEVPEVEFEDWEDDSELTVDNATIFVRKWDERTGEFRKLYRFNVASGHFRAVNDAVNGDVESWQRSPDGKMLAFTTNESGQSVLRVIDTETLAPIAIPALPSAQISRVRWHPKLPQLALAYNEPNSPSDVFVMDLAKQSVTRWTDSRPQGLTRPLNAKTALVEWKSFDGRAISGFLFMPDQRFAGKRPVIVAIHGGPESQARPNFLGRWHYYLNEMGAAILEPNVRGSAGFGKTFLTLDNGRLREDSVKDIGAMLDWIATQPHLDASKIAIIGGSYDGYMSLAVSTHYSDRIACAIDTVGISNFVSFLERTETYRRDLRRSEYGDERDPGMREFLTQISPLTNAQKIRKPLFVVHGINDPRVPFYEAQQIVEKVRANGTPVWTLYADNEGHGFAKRDNADYLFYAQTQFFQQCFQ